MSIRSIILAIAVACCIVSMPALGLSEAEQDDAIEYYDAGFPIVSSSMEQLQKNDTQIFDRLDALESGESSTGKDKIAINLGNGSLAMSGVLPEGKDIFIDGNGADIAWNVNGTSATRSQTPDAGAAAQSTVGQNPANPVTATVTKPVVASNSGVYFPEEETVTVAMNSTEISGNAIYSAADVKAWAVNDSIPNGAEITGRASKIVVEGVETYTPDDNGVVGTFVKCLEGRVEFTPQ